MLRRHFLASLAALVSTAVVAEAAMKAGPNVMPGGYHHRLKSVIGTAPPLDGFTTPTGAYSLRKLKSDYAGSALRIRRASDNLELDIGFSGNDFATATAVAHCAATTCFAKTWYNQTGNASYDISQTTTALQPELVFNCNGTLPCLRSTGAQTLGTVGTITPATGLVSFSAVGNRSVFSAGCTWIRENGNVNRMAATASANTWSVAPAGPSMTLTDGAWHSAQGVLNVAGQLSVFNGDGGTEVTNTTGGPTTAAGAIQILGAASTTCLFAESIVWDNYAITSGERTALYNNQKNYYTPAPLDTFTTPSAAYSFRKLRSAYAGPAVKLQRVDTTTQDISFVGGDFDTAAATVFCTTACTVQTWYDQSGNGRDLVQATAANQPAYVSACNGSLPCARTTANTQTLIAAANVTPATGTVSFSIVGNRSAGTAVCGWLRQNGANNRLTSNSVASQWTLTAGSSIAVAANDNAWHAAQGVIAGAASVVNLDGVETTGTVTGTVTAGQPQIIGGGTTTCNFSESIAWDAYQLAPAERTTLYANQRNYWMPAPLDSFAAPSGAYSFRKLKSTYSGPAIRIRRASDNLETDINFLGFTSFTGAPWDVAAATAHCASTTCYLRTWYNQGSGGATFDLVQATTANQPELVFNCINTQPCARMTFAANNILSTGSLTPATGLASMSAVARRQVGAGAACVLARHNANSNRMQMVAAVGNWGLTGGTSGTVTRPAADGTFHSMQGMLNGASSAVNIDGNELIGTATAAVTAGTLGVTGAGASGTTCDESEMIVWDNYGTTPAERTTLISNQTSYFGPF